MNIFSVFAKQSEAPPPAPDPPVDREAELLEQLHGVDGELALLNDEMRTFRTKHFCVVGGREMVAAPTVTEAAERREEWNQLLRTLSALQARRSEILQAWSESKGVNR